MTRILYLTVALVFADQVSKALATAHLSGQRILFAPGWGLTYTVNRGIWIAPSLSPGYLPWLQAAALLFLVGAAVHVAFYHRYYRRSLWVDLSYAALLSGMLGNLVIDRFLAGGARDFLITPIAICNFADLYGSVFFWAGVVELVQFPKARRFLRWSPPSRWLREGRLLWRFLRVRVLRRRGGGRLAMLLVVLLLSGCSSGGPAPAAPAPAAAPEPTVLLDGTRVRLPEGLTGRVPPGMTTAGAVTLVLQGVAEETANITFSECPPGAPDSGCIGNHRAIKLRGTAVVGGKSVTRFEAEYQKNSAAADSRTWLELHTIVALPSGRRIDIIGQALVGSEREAAFRSAYEALLESLVEAL